MDDYLLDKLEEVNESAKKIYSTAELISLNLQIQSAHLKSDGHVFVVIAREMTKLAREAKEKGREMENIIKQIRTENNN